MTVKGKALLGFEVELPLPVPDENLVVVPVCGGSASGV